ncbi:MAG: 50S ribosome-binding GTPase [Flaviflexus sp.]|nr:50S ribosome-binding GTPase [Flaviflexus sp.]
MMEELRRAETALSQALTAGASHMDQFALARAHSDLAETRHRMSLGEGLTVIALVGGTGSGKSTMFNALTDLTFADAGELRPTTDRAAACTWGTDAKQMLDFLGVDEDRRIRRGSALVDEEPELAGLVILDLPDHDSVEVSHAVQVSRLVPLVDLLIWVLDPQKYADEALHSGYLSALRARSEAMIVVLNQIDTVPIAAREDLVADCRRLLAADGLGEVPVLTASALTREGLDEIKVHIASACTSSPAAATARADISRIAKRLSSSVGESEPGIDESANQTAATSLASACGAGAVAESLRAGGSSWTRPALARPEKPSADAISAIREAWLDKHRSGLPSSWAGELTEAVAGPEKIRRAAGEVAEGVPARHPSRTSALLLLGLGVLAGLGAALCLVLGVSAPHLLPTSLAMRLILIIALVAGSFTFISAARRMRSIAAARAANSYASEMGRGMSAVVREHLAERARPVLERHAATREGLHVARG